MVVGRCSASTAAAATQVEADVRRRWRRRAEDPSIRRRIMGERPVGVGGGRRISPTADCRWRSIKQPTGDDHQRDHQQANRAAIWRSRLKSSAGAGAKQRPAEADSLAATRCGGARFVLFSFASFDLRDAPTRLEPVAVCFSSSSPSLWLTTKAKVTLLFQRPPFPVASENGEKHAPR